jgi:hypothetical protein
MSPTEATSFWSRWRLDIVLIGLAVLSVIFTLSYPVGTDQGGFHYVGRAWFFEGRLPYRDAVEHKPPGIYLYYGLIVRLLGDNMWGVRVVDLALTQVLGVLCARLMSPRGVERGMIGAACFFGTIMHYGFFMFWDTAQCDFVAMLFLFCSVYVLIRGRSDRMRAPLAGLFIGLSILMKPYAPALLLPGGLLLHRLFRARKTPLVVLRDAASATALAIAPFALVLLYFHHRGALGDLVEWVVRVNKFYWTHERGVADFEAFVRCTQNIFTIYAAFGGSLLGAGLLCTLLALRNGDMEKFRYCLLAWALILAGYGAVAIQLKFFRYHLGAIIPGAICLSVIVFREARERLGWDRHFGVKVVAVVAMFYASTEQSGWLYFRSYTRTLKYWAGTISRPDFLRPFDITQMGFSFADSEAAGDYIRSRTRPEEEILVRGFNTQIYVVAHRYYSGRFYWSSFLTDPTRMMRPQEWRTEDEEHWKRVKPRFIVTTQPAGAVVGPQEYRAFGYVDRAQFGIYQVLEYAPGEAPKTQL